MKIVYVKAMTLACGMAALLHAAVDRGQKFRGSH